MSSLAASLASESAPTFMRMWRTRFYRITFWDGSMTAAVVDDFGGLVFVTVE